MQNVGARLRKRPPNTHNSYADLSLGESSNNWSRMGDFSEDVMGVTCRRKKMTLTARYLVLNRVTQANIGTLPLGRC